MIVTLGDMRKAAYCSRGARDFFARYRLNWILFVQNGIDSEELKNIPDPMVARVIEIAQARTNGR